jgi:hypothetical protein
VKKCTKCGELKSFSEFHKSRNHKDGLKPRCKVCRNIANKKHREENPEYYKKWRDNNKDYVKNYNDRYREENKEVLDAKKKEYVAANEKLVAARKKTWYEKNKERVLAKKKAYYEEHRDEIIAREQLYVKNSITAQISKKLRSRFYQAVKKGYRAGSAVRDLGCSVKELKVYLEKKFQPGMNWKNYGKWHIDHIIPLSSFDLTDRDQVKKACHYTNLQPLWAEDNLKKWAKMPNKE